MRIWILIMLGKVLEETSVPQLKKIYDITSQSLINNGLMMDAQN
jgi:hypothetical protein